LKTALNFSLALCLLFSPVCANLQGGAPGDARSIANGPFPTSSLADDGSPVRLLPGGYEMMDGLPAALAGPVAPGDTHYLSLTGLDFHPVSSDMTYSEMNGGVYALAVVPGSGFFASYHLPDGSTVTAITFYVYDASTTNNIELGAYAYNPATNNSVTLGAASSTGDSGSMQVIDLSLASGSFTIANGTNAYRLRVGITEAGADLQVVFGARISYSLPLVPSATDYVTLAGADMRSSSSNMTYTNVGGMVYATAFAASNRFMKRLDLPQGAVIDQVEWFVIDNSDTDYLDLALYAHRLLDNSVTIPADSTTNGATTSEDIQNFTDTPSITIDNALRAYTIAFLPTAATINLFVAGARVRYTPPETPTFGTQVKSYSGAHFLPSSSSLTYQALDSALYELATASGRSFQLILGLPSTSRIDRVTFFFVDESFADFIFGARLNYPALGGYIPLGSISSSESSTDLRTVTLESLGPVDTATQVPLLRVLCGEAGEVNLLVGAQVEYSFPTIFLPLVVR
jgi:hypothetical protein